jgi:hypothetical protein
VVVVVVVLVVVVVGDGYREHCAGGVTTEITTSKNSVCASHNNKYQKGVAKREKNEMVACAPSGSLLEAQLCHAHLSTATPSSNGCGALSQAYR